MLLADGEGVLIGRNGRRWVSADGEIRRHRNTLTKEVDSVARSLVQVCESEITHQYRLWDGEYDEALNRVKEVIEGLEGGKELRPYRSFWQHQAAVVSFLQWKNTKKDHFRELTADFLRQAATTSSGIRWLGRIRATLEGREIEDEGALPVQDWFRVLSDRLAAWGLRGKRFAREVATLRKDIESDNAEAFERGLAMLGEMVGAKSYTWREDGAPDGLWIFGDWQAYVFEAKTDSRSDSLSLKSVRQARTHEERVRADRLILDYTPCFTVIISDHSTIDRIAVPHADDLHHIAQKAVVALFERAAVALSELRNVAPSMSEELLQLEAKRVYEKNRAFISDVRELLLSQPLTDLPGSR